MWLDRTEDRAEELEPPRSNSETKQDPRFLVLGFVKDDEDSSKEEA